MKAVQNLDFEPLSFKAPTKIRNNRFQDLPKNLHSQGTPRGR